MSEAAHHSRLRASLPGSVPPRRYRTHRQRRRCRNPPRRSRTDAPTKSRRRLDHARLVRRRTALLPQAPPGMPRQSPSNVLQSDSGAITLSLVRSVSGNNLDPFAQGLRRKTAIPSDADRSLRTVAGDDPAQKPLAVLPKPHDPSPMDLFQVDRPFRLNDRLVAVLFELAVAERRHRSEQFGLRHTSAATAPGRIRASPAFQRRRDVRPKWRYPPKEGRALKYNSVMEASLRDVHGDRRIRRTTGERRGRDHRIRPGRTPPVFRKREPGVLRDPGTASDGSSGAGTGPWLRDRRVPAMRRELRGSDQAGHLHRNGALPIERGTDDGGPGGARQPPSLFGNDETRPAIARIIAPSRSSRGAPSSRRPPGCPRLSPPAPPS